MKSIWLRRLCVVAVASVAAVVAGCGAGTVFSAFAPSRVIVFGDAFSDVGHGGSKYTVNDASTNTWVEQIAGNYGKSVVAASAGGLGYARGNARIVLKPDAVGLATTLTVKEQIDAFLATGNFTSADAVFINGGISDMVVQGVALTAGTISAADLTTNAAQAGKDLATQVRRMVSAGATHVIVAGVYDMSKSPWGANSGQAAALSAASLQFNIALLTSIVDLGGSVLYVDAAYYLNLLANQPASYGLTNSASAVCTSVDAGAGIGVGAGDINSAQCTTATITAGAIYNSYMFADKLYLTPAANRLWGDYATGRMRTRW